MPRANQSTFLLALITAIGFNGLGLFQSGEVVAADAASLPASEELVEESPFLVEPETPVAILDAVILMVDLGRPKLAKQYLEQLIALHPDDATILRMRDKHGPAAFLALANNKDLQPLSIQLLDQMNAAMRQSATDSSRIDQLIRDLSGSTAQREVATLELRGLGDVAVPRMLAVLVDENQSERHRVVQETLSELGNEAIAPLLGALDVTAPDVKAAVLGALGRLGGSDIAIYLWYPAFGPDQPSGVQTAAREALARILYASPDRVDKVSSLGITAALRNAATTHFRRDFEWPLEDDGTVKLWIWNSDNHALETAHVTPEAASLFAGTRFARQAVAILPENTESQALYLAFALASDAYLAGWANPLPTGPGTAHNLALLAGADMVSDVLALALKHTNPLTALPALQALGQIATRHNLYQNDGSPSPMVAALNYPDTRIQFAAASAILQTDPEIGFPGASRVVDVLTRAVKDAGVARSVVVDPNTQRGSELGGILHDLGYEPQLETTGRDGFRAAAERGDVELVLLHARTIQWNLSITVANLRADARTTGIPIAIVGDGALRPRIEGLIKQYPLVTFLVESGDTDSIGAQLRPFLKSMKTPPLTQPQRSQLRAAAVYWLSYIADGRRTGVFNLAPAEEALFEAIEFPELASDALLAASGIASRTVQDRFEEVAINSTRDNRIRELAALQLAFHIQRFGLLLSKDRVDAIQSAWTKATDSGLKTALASVIGSLKPNAARIQERLDQYPKPTTPPQTTPASAQAAP